jgi:hypothetical protein
MTKERASMFDSDEPVPDSVSSPKTAYELNDEIVRVVAKGSRFPSRETMANRPAEAAIPARRPPRIHRTGRTMQFAARTTPQTVEGMYAIADQKGWLVGETLEHALAALQRELTGQDKP